MARISAAMLPAVALTKEDVHDLRVLSHELEAEVVSAYEDFLFRRAREVDLTRWRLQRTHEDMAVYRKRDDRHSHSHSHSQPHSQSHSYSHRHADSHIRKPSVSTSSHGSGTSCPSECCSSTESSCRSRTHSSHSHSSSISIRPLAAMAATSRSSLLLATGSAPGTVDEAMYGLHYQDTASLRAHQLYQRRPMEDCAVLHAVDTADCEDPFQFLGIAWSCVPPPVVAPLMHMRDMVVLVHQHQSTLSTGEAIGVSLTHSIQHRALPELSAFSIIRMPTSTLTVVRQLDEHRVEFFALEFADALGHAPDALAKAELTKNLLHLSDIGETALRKKLRWLMQERQRHRALARVHDHAVPVANRRTRLQSQGQAQGGNENRHPTCHLCLKTCGQVFHHAIHVCQLCDKRVCRKCSTSKKLLADPTSATSALEDFTLCVACILYAREYPVLDIAQEQVQERERQARRSQHSEHRNTRRTIESSNHSNHSNGSGGVRSVTSSFKHLNC